MQSYTEIPSAQTLQSSLSLLLNNHKSILSCFSGTVFPTSNLQVGMLCYRTDQAKLFQLKGVFDGVTNWVEIANLNATIDSKLEKKLNSYGGIVTGVLVLESGVNAYSASTGALIVKGGIGVSGDVYASNFRGALIGNASTASKLLHQRHFTLSGAVESGPTAFDGSAAVTINVTSLNAGSLRGVVPLACLSGTYGVNITGSSSYAASCSEVDGHMPGRRHGKFLPVVGDGAGVMEIGRYIDFHGDNASTEDYTVRLDGGGVGSTTLTLAGNFVASGNVTAYSDRRVKANIRRLENAVSKIERIKGVTFTRKDRPHRDSKRRYMGVIAQDVRKVAPEAVSVHDGRMAVDYMGLVGLVIESIKELNVRLARIEKGI